ncbi:PREDICTED: uncharacterized protein LOC107339008 [Acropora digitifera]|uniref:uncharacterized protein LOC107339008 n=1 Tax=Acropora digitifera TaxID=70779 RepID=UPI00077A975B|nr:PREDICTED: uncharacterized protein LOC107339008 [Acropora digitifera]
MADPKSFRKIMKNIFPGNKKKITTPQSIKTDDGETVIDQPTIAQRFNEFFTAGPSVNVRQFSNRKFTSKRFILQPISEGFILKQLRDLKDKKATGLDRIPARFLRDSAAVIAPTVTFLVNLSLSTGSVPDEWKKALIVPLYKSGGRENMDKYRPISILSVLSNILEKIVNFQLQQYLKKFDLLSPAQSGFRQHHSTESAVSYFTDEIRRNADAGRLTGAFFVDLKKTFDTVRQKELISKLECFGFVDNSTAWFTNYLSNRFEVVSLGTNLLRPLAVGNGVSEFMLLQNVERFKSQQEKEKSPEKICHDSLKLIDKALSQHDNNARVQVLKDNVASKWCDLQEVQVTMCTMLKDVEIEAECESQKDYEEHVIESMAKMTRYLAINKLPKEVVGKWELELNEDKATQDCVEVKTLFTFLEQLIRARVFRASSS